jgi:hypothetical protein
MVDKKKGECYWKSRCSMKRKQGSRWEKRRGTAGSHAILGAVGADSGSRGRYTERRKSQVLSVFQ